MCHIGYAAGAGYPHVLPCRGGRQRFLLAAKALVRYPEIKEDTRGHFAEYFLVGTLTSVGLALIAGMIVNKLKGSLS